MKLISFGRLPIAPSAEKRAGAHPLPPSVSPLARQRVELHRKLRVAFRDMKRAESDGGYESAKANFDDLCRQLATLATNSVGVVPMQDVDASAPGFVG